VWESLDNKEFFIPRPPFLKGRAPFFKKGVRHIWKLRRNNIFRLAFILLTGKLFFILFSLQKDKKII